MKQEKNFKEFENNLKNKKHHPFRLSKSNIILSVIVSLIVVFLNTRFVNFDGFTVGTMIGSVIGVLLLPLLFALLFWFVKGRKKQGGTITYNVVICLMLFGQCSEFSRNIQTKENSSEDILTARDEFKSNTRGNPDSITTNYNKYSETVDKSMEELIASSAGDERQVYLIIQEYLSKMNTVYSNWSKANDKVLAPDVFDFELINTTEECDRQIKIIDDYILESSNYHDFFLNRTPYLTEELKVVGLNSKRAKRFMKSLREKDSLQMPVFKPYIKAHIEFGKGLNKILKLAKQNIGKWKIEDGYLLFEAAEVQSKYDEYLNNVVEHEETVNTFYDKLLDVM